MNEYHDLPDRFRDWLFCCLKDHKFIKDDFETEMIKYLQFPIS
jgi:hypothetical protein